MRTFPIPSAWRWSRPARLGTGLLAACLAAPSFVVAQGFALYVSPPRFEVKAKAGETRRLILEFSHVGHETGHYRVYTNDWELKDDVSVQFRDALAQDSCRPWVAVERRELTIAPNGRYRFRFEITPPADTPPRECRFALMVEGLDTSKMDQGTFSFPVAGRIGVIVYVQIGGAEPKLSFGRAFVQVQKGERVPVVEVSNTGNAHGRLEGFLTGKDAMGKEFDMAPDDVPILPGKTRAIVLHPVFEEGKKPSAIQYPLTVKGALEWGKNRESLDLRFEP